MQLKIERYLERPRFLPFLAISLSFLLSFASMGAVFLAMKIDLAEAFGQFFLASFGDWYSFSELLVKTTPLIFSGIAVLVALKTRLWNIGVEGQLFMGAFGASSVAYAFSGLPVYALLPLVTLAGAVTGAIWALLPALLKIGLNIGEVLTSLLLNYVAISWVHHLIYGPWADPAFRGFPQTPAYVVAARLPHLAGSRVHLGLVLALLVVLVLHFIIQRTTWGYEMEAIGACPQAARYAGMQINRNVVIVLMLSGALAGLAGMSEISGVQYKLRPGGISSGYGYIGILIAWLANRNALAVVLVALITGAIFVGVEMLQITIGLSIGMVLFFEGIFLVFLLTGDFFMKYRIRLGRDGR